MNLCRSVHSVAGGLLLTRRGCPGSFMLRTVLCPQTWAPGAAFIFQSSAHASRPQWSFSLSGTVHRPSPGPPGHCSSWPRKACGIDVLNGTWLCSLKIVFVYLCVRRAPHAACIFLYMSLCSYKITSALKVIPPSGVTLTVPFSAGPLSTPFAVSEE